MPLSPGTTLGPYSVTAKIGEGGMGEVYRARDTKLDRDVALKVLPQAFTDDPDRLARFEREAKVLASLNHPNIGGIHGVEELDGLKILVLELVEGPTLADRMAKGPLPLDEALPIAKRVEDALDAVHRHGIVHGDLTPADVKVMNDGTVKVLGFGYGRDASVDPEVDRRAFEALCEALLGMKTPRTSAVPPPASQGPEPGRQAIPLTSWIWVRRLGSLLLSFVLVAGLLSVLWPNTVSETAGPRRSLVWVDQAGNEEPVWPQVAAYRNPRLSPDGTRIAVEIASDDHDIWILDLVRRIQIRLTADSARDIYPVWTLDGQAVVFSRMRLTSGPTRDSYPIWTPDGERVLWSARSVGVFLKAAAGSRRARSLVSMPGRGFYPYAAVGQQLVAVSVSGTELQHDIGVIAMDGEPVWEPLLSGPWTVDDPAVSPNGRWIAYASNMAGQRAVHVQPFPEVEGGRWVIASRGPGEDPLWSRDGRVLFYRSPLGMMAVPVQLEPGVAFGAAQPLFDDVYYCCEGRNYDVSSDGRFLMIKNEAPSDPGTRQSSLIRHWLEDLTRLFPDEWLMHSWNQDSGKGR